MENTEAHRLLTEKLDDLRSRPYTEWRSWRELNQIENVEVEGSSGTIYQLETQTIWDDRKRGHIRVMVAIDDGGRRALVPMTADFIIAPNGSFIGEPASEFR